MHVHYRIEILFLSEYTFLIQESYSFLIQVMENEFIRSTNIILAYDYFLLMTIVDLTTEFQRRVNTVMKFLNKVHYCVYIIFLNDWKFFLYLIAWK